MATSNCSTTGCGTGGWDGPLPGDPDNSSVLSATSEFGGIQLSWTMPSLNAYAISHTKLYRSTGPIFASAMPLAYVSGSQYFDKSAANNIQPYFYWIQHVSINGTELNPIGPAQAVAKPQIDEVIGALAGKIESSALAESLRTRIDKISDLETGLTQVNQKVLTENGVLTQELLALRDDVSGALAYISE